MIYTSFFGFYNMDCVSENQSYISKTNQFKIQMEQLLEQFRLLTFKDQLKLLSDVRRFFLEVEDICNAISHHAHHHHDVDKVLHSEFLPIGSYACDVISTSLQGDHVDVDGKLTSSSITTPDDIIQEDDEVPVDGAPDQATLEETDIRQIADYLLGFSKLTVGAMCNSNDHQIIMNPDSTSLLELQSPACVQIRAATAETDHQHHALPDDTSVDDMACNETCSRIDIERKEINNDDETKNQSVHESADGSTMASTSPRPLGKRPDPQSRIALRSTLPSSPSSGALSCVKCRSLFENVEQLNQHSCDHRDHNDFINGCKDDDHIVASTLASRRSALRRHVKRRNVANLARRFYECDRCERKFVKRPSLFSHQREHAGPNEVVCLKCGVTSADAEQHAVHVQKHVEHAPFRCGTCGESFARRQQYDRHTAGHRLYDCTDCDGDHVAHFSTAKQVARHRRLVHGAVHSMQKKQRHECLVCQRTFLRRRQLELHQRRSHSTDVAIASKSRTKCSLCSKSFRTQSAMAKHLVIAHQQQQTFVTSDGQQSSSAFDPAVITVKRFSSTEEEVQAVVAKVRRQTTSITLEARRGVNDDEAGSRRRRRQDKPTVRRKEDTDAGYLCSVCGAKFLRKQCLVRHNRQQHDGGILYECDFCDYRCNCKANLKRHVELHVNERRRFVCELCAASFHALATLKEHHAYVHCEERRHACSECGKSFKSKSALQRHARIHNDRRPYVCTQCTQAYKRMSHLKRHMATVHGAVFESKRVQRLRGERESLTISAPHPVPPPPPTYVVQHQQLTSNVNDSDVRIDIMTAPSNNINNNNDFLMSIGVDQHVAKTSQLLDSVPIGQCLQPLPPMADIVPSAGGPLPSMPRRLLHHHAFLDVDYTAACHANDLQPIDVLQSDLAANSGSIDGSGKISDMFW